MNKFRLAVFNTQPPQLYRGGVERRINETTRRLVAEADITVYRGTKAGFKNPTIINGVNFVPLKSTDRIYPLDNWTFNRTISQTNIEADGYEAHNDNGYGLLKAFKRQATKKPLVHTIHGVLADEFEQAKLNGYASFRGRVANRFMARLARLEGETAQKADVMVTISRYSLEKMQAHYNVDPSKVRIVPNGVDPEKYVPTEKPADLKHKLGLGDVPVGLFVGSLIPRKGVGFLIVGDAPLKPQLTTDLAAANLTGNFTFKSGLNEEELVELYGASDVFVLPSVQEGQGIVLLEASASGKPVVAFDIGGVNEAVIKGETGLLVNRGSSGELVEALLKLLGDANLKQKMGLAGRHFVVDNYTWDICAQKMLKVYREALELKA
jgi:glycosyltransferase involved in cell wall biosynthesis